MNRLRLGDDLDDHCIKCKRVTNHAIVALVNDAPAKVRCRSCYHDHEFLHEQAPPSKKDLKKLQAASAPAPEAAQDDVAPIDSIE